SVWRHSGYNLQALVFSKVCSYCCHYFVREEIWKVSECHLDYWSHNHYCKECAPTREDVDRLIARRRRNPFMIQPSVDSEELIAGAIVDDIPRMEFDTSASIPSYYAIYITRPVLLEPEPPSSPEQSSTPL